MKLRKLHLRDYSVRYQKRLIKILVGELESRYDYLQASTKLVYGKSGLLIDRSLPDIKAEAKVILKRKNAEAAEKFFREVKDLVLAPKEDVVNKITRAQWNDFKATAEERNAGDRAILNKLVKENKITVDELREFLTSEDNVPIYDPPSPRLKKFIEDFGYSPMVMRFIDHFGLERWKKKN